MNAIAPEIAPATVVTSVVAGALAWRRYRPAALLLAISAAIAIWPCIDYLRSPKSQTPASPSLNGLQDFLSGPPIWPKLTVKRPPITHVRRGLPPTLLEPAILRFLHENAKR